MENGIALNMSDSLKEWQILNFVANHNLRILVKKTFMTWLTKENWWIFMKSTEQLKALSFRLGSWQFMSDMPYKCVSMAMMWRLVWLMHQSYKDGTVDIDQYMTVEQCLADLDGEQI